jgi:hypothetical protein
MSLFNSLCYFNVQPVIQITKPGARARHGSHLQKDVEHTFTIIPYEKDKEPDFSLKSTDTREKSPDQNLDVTDITSVTSVTSVTCVTSVTSVTEVTSVTDVT